MLRTFLPWVIYSILSVAYFAYSMDDRNLYMEGDRKIFWLIVEILIILSVIYQLFIELKQMMKEKLSEYFCSPYNLIDLLQYIGTLIVVSTNMAKYDGLIMSYKRNICVFVLIAQAVKFVIDWLRLFGNTSFYVTLITRTMSDIVYFVIIQLALLYYIGIAVYMLQLDADPYNQDYIVEPVFDNFLVDSLLN